MIRILIVVALLGCFAIAATSAQVQNFSPVTREMLLNPSPDDWLMLSRTYDEQRFSPLNQINRQDVGQLRMVWVRGMAPGTQETDACLDMEAKAAHPTGFGIRVGTPRPGSDPQKFAGIAKVNMATGRIQRFYSSPFPSNGAMLATAGNLVFAGDLNRRFRAFDAETGKVLWETILGGIIQMSTITYAVNGRQYVAVMTGDGQSATTNLLRQVPTLAPPRGHNAIYVFALPDR